METSKTNRFFEKKITIAGTTTYSKDRRENKYIDREL